LTNTRLKAAKASTRKLSEAAAVKAGAVTFRGPRKNSAGAAPFKRLNSALARKMPRTAAEKGSRTRRIWHGEMPPSAQPATKAMSRNAAGV
jgi:hypothetical protein